MGLVEPLKNGPQGSQRSGLVADYSRSALDYLLETSNRLVGESVMAVVVESWFVMDVLMKI